MPCYLFTWHAYGTWMPDRKRGYVKKQKMLPPNAEIASAYRRRQAEPSLEFDLPIQHLLVEELQVTSEYR